MRTIRNLLFAAVVLAAAFSLSACGGSGDGGGSQQPTESKGPITIGSKIDTEGELLATLTQLTLEANGFKVTDKSQTGTTDVVRQALLSGEIDMYPEYTGSGLIFFEGEPGVTPEAFKDPQGGYDLVKKLDVEKNQIVWLAPAKANNTWAVAAKKDFVQREGLATMSDFAQYVNDGGTVKFIGSDEFFNNSDAMPQFEKTYGFKLTDKQRLIVSGGNTAQTEKAVADGTNDVNFGMAYGTDGALASLGLVVLDDDKQAQLVYWPTMIVTKATLDKYPEIETVLKPVFDSLDLQKLQELNARIQVNGESAEAVAQDYLVSNNLINQ